MEIRITHKTCFSCVITFFLMLCCIANAYNTTTTAQHPERLKIPCFFVFGDSLVDHGNNNDLLTSVKSNFLPYGVDFPGGATGRFSNGLTFVDILSEYLGIVGLIPPSSRAKDVDLLRGVNFAAGAAGIRDETGDYLGINIPMNQQITNFAKVVERMREHFMRDEEALQNYLSKCIVYSGIGSNDYLNNYFMSWRYSTSKKFTPEEFAQDLIHDYTRQLTDLYNLGVRKVIVPGVAQIGCIPFKRKKLAGTKKSICNENENNAVQHFNRALRKLVDTFNDGQLPGAKFVYLDHYGACMHMVSNSSFYGLEVVDKGCCGVGKNTNGGEITCLPWQTPCGDRAKYVFWDAFHPTEMVHRILANMAYSSKTDSHAFPINVKQLAML